MKALAIAHRFKVKARSSIWNARTSEPSDSWTLDRGQIAVNEPCPEPQARRKSDSDARSAAGASIAPRSCCCGTARDVARLTALRRGSLVAQTEMCPAPGARSSARSDGDRPGPIQEIPGIAGWRCGRLVTIAHRVSCTRGRSDPIRSEPLFLSCLDPNVPRVGHAFCS